MYSTPEQLSHELAPLLNHRIFGLEIGQISLSEAKSLKKDLIQLQKKLRALKKKSTASKKEINSEFSAKRADVSSPVTGFFLGKKASGQANAREKEYLRQEKEAVIAPYLEFESYVDQVISNLDDTKYSIDEYIDFLKDNPPGPKPSSPSKKPPPIPEVPLSKKYFVFYNDEVFGPYTIDQFIPLVDFGIVTSESSVCQEGMEEWVPYEKLM